MRLSIRSARVNASIRAGMGALLLGKRLAAEKCGEGLSAAGRMIRRSTLRLADEIRREYRFSRFRREFEKRQPPRAEIIGRIHEVFVCVAWQGIRPCHTVFRFPGRGVSQCPVCGSFEVVPANFFANFRFIRLRENLSKIGAVSDVPPTHLSDIDDAVPGEAAPHRGDANSDRRSRFRIVYP